MSQCVTVDWTAAITTNVATATTLIEVIRRQRSQSVRRREGMRITPRARVP